MKRPSFETLFDVNKAITLMLDDEDFMKDVFVVPVITQYHKKIKRNLIKKIITKVNEKVVNHSIQTGEGVRIPNLGVIKLVRKKHFVAHRGTDKSYNFIHYQSSNKKRQEIINKGLIPKSDEYPDGVEWKVYVKDYTCEEGFLTWDFNPIRNVFKIDNMLVSLIKPKNITWYVLNFNKMPALAKLKYFRNKSLAAEIKKYDRPKTHFVKKYYWEIIKGFSTQ